MRVTQLMSLQNPKVKATVALRDRKTRDANGLTLLEGYRELTRAFEYGMTLKSCFFCPSQFLGVNEMTFLRELDAADVPLYEVSESVLCKMAYRDRPEGLIATALIPTHQLSTLNSLTVAPLYLVAEEVEKPGNLGSILRSADAAGASGLIITDPRTDLYNPNTIRASTGALFALPIAITNNQDCYAFLTSKNIQILSATPHTHFNYTDVDLTLPTAIIVGAEQYGLSDFWLERCTQQVKIPMLGRIDSLNVATAATLLVYEAARQRQWQSSLR